MPGGDGGGSGFEKKAVIDATFEPVKEDKKKSKKNSAKPAKKGFSMKLGGKKEKAVEQTYEEKNFDTFVSGYAKRRFGELITGADTVLTQRLANVSPQEKKSLYGKIEGTKGKYPERRPRQGARSYGRSQQRGSRAALYGARGGHASYRNRVRPSSENREKARRNRIQGESRRDIGDSHALRC